MILVDEEGEPVSTSPAAADDAAPATPHPQSQSAPGDGRDAGGEARPDA